MRRQPNAFWRYSLELYRVNAVADACLGLQDRGGADVNLLLFCCWQGSLGHALSKPLLRKVMAAVADWQSQVVLPLRQARRFIKAGIPAMPLRRREQLRKDIAAVELAAEYLEQLLLVEYAADKTSAARRSASTTAVAANLQRYLELLKIPLEPALQRHLETLRAACRTRLSG